MVRLLMRRVAMMASAGLCVVLAAAVGGVHADDAAVFKAGAFAQDITPEKFPISVNGNMTDVLAQGAADPLHARCLVLDDGKTTIAMVVVDSCMVPREIHEAAKELANKATGIPKSNILISATHAHSCPTLGAVFQSEPDLAYIEFLKKKIAEGITTAWKKRAPAKLGFGVAKDPSQLFNRRWKLKQPSSSSNPFGKLDMVRMNPGLGSPDVSESTGIIDPEIGLISVRTADDKPLALYATYSLHYVGGTPPGAVSADYFAVYCERMTQLLGATTSNPEFVAMISNGTSGDVNNVNFGASSLPNRTTMGQIKVVAESVAQASFAVYGGISHSEKVTLGAAETDLQLAVRKPSDEDVAMAKETLSMSGEFPYKTMKAVYARETLKLVDFPATVPVKVQVLKVGPVAVYSIPCEVFTEIGLELKEKSPVKPCFSVSLANGYNGYLPTPRQHEWAGYETWRARSSYLEEQASVKIVAKLLELAGSLAK
jgi:neutral ceramidase